MNVFCTYFDSRFLPRGMAMWRSLRRVQPDARLWVLCLDDVTYQILREAGDLGLEPLSLAELESWDPGVAAVRLTRSLVEYYFTLSPVLPLWVLDRCPEASSVTYLDADLWFFSSPEPLFEELGESSVGIIAHRFTTYLERNEVYGRYNVGWVTFRQDGRAREVLRDWRGRCLDWCFDRVEEGRFADQGYLNDWPERFGAVRVLEHLGGNVAPWNLGRYRLEVENGRPTVDGVPILFFHFHGLRRTGRHLWWPQLAQYGVTPDKEVYVGLYRPYIREVVREEERWSARLAVTSRSAAAGVASPADGPRGLSHPSSVAGTARGLLGGSAMTTFFHRSLLPDPRKLLARYAGMGGPA